MDKKLHVLWCENSSECMFVCVLKRTSRLIFMKFRKESHHDVHLEAVPELLIISSSADGVHTVEVQRSFLNLENVIC